MKPINTIGTIVFALSLTIIFVIGCEQVQDHIGGKSTEPGVTSVSPDEVDPDAIQTGTVVIADAADEWGVDEYVLNAAAIIDDRLELSVSYSGGCKNHQFTLVCSSVFHESDPVQLSVSLAHNANNDPCEAFPTETYHFDLTPIKTLYQTAYQQEAGVVILLLKAAPNDKDVPDDRIAYRLVYEFGM